jgi:uncharacterized protein YeeX (DUF496 family)
MYLPRLPAAFSYTSFLEMWRRRIIKRITQRRNEKSIERNAKQVLLLQNSRNAMRRAYAWYSTQMAMQAGG